MENKTKRDVVYRAIKKNIFSGYHMPGARLIELELAARYDVSRTIVREVIKQLASEGMISLVPYKGARVTKTSLEDLKEIYRIYQDLEGLAAYLATPLLSRTHMDELDQVHRASQNHMNGDVEGWQKLHTRFHRILLENCGNRRLVKLVKSHCNQFAHYWFLLFSIPGCIEKSIKEHEQIIAAIKDKKPGRVRSLTEKHVEAGAKRIMDIMKHTYRAPFTS